ncbi:MAG: hypothetical protein ACPHK8_07600 [Thermoplasmatota archaeon]
MNWYNMRCTCGFTCRTNDKYEAGRFYQAHENRNAAIGETTHHTLKVTAHTVKTEELLEAVIA